MGQCQSPEAAAKKAEANTVALFRAAEQGNGKLVRRLLRARGVAVDKIDQFWREACCLRPLQTY